MVRFLACDLDGTLLNRQGNITPRTLAALLACRERGVRIAFATARSEEESGRFTRLFAPDCFISCGGALACAHGAVVYKAALSKGVVNGLLRDMLALDCFITMMDERGRFLSSGPMRGDYAHFAPYDFSRGVDCGAYKVTSDIADDNDALAIARRHPGSDLFTFSGETWRRFAHPKASKELALAALLQHLDISPADVAAFGDDANDRGMLSLCGHGVAMGNASTDVRRAARYITADCDHDGVGAWLEAHVLCEP